MKKSITLLMFFIFLLTSFYSCSAKQKTQLEPIEIEQYTMYDFLSSASVSIYDTEGKKYTWESQFEYFPNGDLKKAITYTQFKADNERPDSFPKSDFEDEQLLYPVVRQFQREYDKYGRLMLYQVKEIRYPYTTDTEKLFSRHKFDYAENHEPNTENVLKRYQGDMQEFKFVANQNKQFFLRLPYTINNGTAEKENQYVYNFLRWELNIIKDKIYEMKKREAEQKLLEARETAYKQESEYFTRLSNLRKMLEILANFFENNELEDQTKETILKQASAVLDLITNLNKTLQRPKIERISDEKALKIYLAEPEMIVEENGKQEAENKNDEAKPTDQITKEEYVLLINEIYDFSLEPSSNSFESAKRFARLIYSLAENQTYSSYFLYDFLTSVKIVRYSPILQREIEYEDKMSYYSNGELKGITTNHYVSYDDDFSEKLSTYHLLLMQEHKRQYDTYGRLTEYQIKEREYKMKWSENLGRAFSTADLEKKETIKSVRKFEYKKAPADQESYENRYKKDIEEVENLRKDDLEYSLRK